MIRFVVPLLILFICLAPQAAEAYGCGCIHTGPAGQVRQAEQVLLVRTVSVTPASEGHRIEFDVLHTVKGEAVESFSWVREYGGSPCKPNYQVGEVAMLFVRGDNLPFCGGNKFLWATLGQFSEYLQRAGQKPLPLSRTDMREALSATFKAYLHGRPMISAYYGPLAGKTLPLEDTRIRFRRPAKGQTTPGHFPEHALVVINAARWRDMVSLSAVYRREGLIIRILLQDTGKGYTVLYQDVVER